MASEKPDLNALAKAGINAQSAAKPESAPIDLSTVGGKVIASSHTSSEPIDLSSLYGQRGGRLQRRSPVEPSDEQ